MNAPVRPPLILSDAQFEDMTRRGAFVKVGRVELRGGMIASIGPVYLKHAVALGALLPALVAATKGRGLPLEVTPEISIRFGGGFQPTADIAVWDRVAVPEDYDGPLPSAAVKLVVEIADSSLADDLGAKAGEYAAAGLAEYWVADVRSRTVFLHADPGPTGYARRQALAFGVDMVALTLPLTVTTAGV